MTRTTMAIALGSALGGVSRYLAGLAMHAWVARTFPWSTLAVKVLASTSLCLAGVWTGLLVARHGSA